MDKSLEKLFDIISELKEDIGTIKNDIVWIKKAIADIYEKQENCKMCNNAEYIYKQTNTNRTNMEQLMKERAITIGISIAASSIVGLIVTLITLNVIKIG